MTAQKPQGQVTERRFSWQFLLLGILDIIIALLAFRDPHATLGSVVYYFGFMAIFQGCTILLMANAVSRYFGIKNIIFIKITLYEEVNGIAKPSDSDIVDPGA